MVDADVAGHDDSAGVNRHWLVNSVTVSSEWIGLRQLQDQSHRT